VGETSTDTARELAALRGETERLLATLEGQARQVAAVGSQACAFVAGTHNVATALGLGVGTAATIAVLAIWMRNYRRAQLARRRRALLRAGATRQDLAETLGLPAAHASAAVPAQPAGRQGDGLVERVAGAVVASATLALVDQFTRWLSQRQATGARPAVG